MKFKRLRVLKGDSLVIPVGNDYMESVLYGTVTSGSGLPVGEMSFMFDKLILDGNATVRLDGLYKYRIHDGTSTVQYGYIEVL